MLADPVELTTIAFGFLTGLLVGFTGMGGGALMGPVLILGLGVPPVIAVGVDRVYSAVTKLVGGMIGIGLLALLRAWGSDPNVLVMKALGVALVLASLAILLRAFLANRAPRPAPTC